MGHTGVEATTRDDRRKRIDIIRRTMIVPTPPLTKTQQLNAKLYQEKMFWVTDIQTTNRKDPTRAATAMESIMSSETDKELSKTDRDLKNAMLKQSARFGR